MKRLRAEEHHRSREGRLPLFAILARSWSPLRVRRQVERFGDNPGQIVMAFIPRRPRPGPWVYFLFGGGWTSGSVRLWSFVGNWFAGQGIPAVLGGYRLAPGHVFPAQLDDALAGFAFSLRHDREFGLSGRSAILSGASAGGHLAALAALRLARDHAVPAGENKAARPAGLLVVNAALDLMISPTRRGDAAIEALTGHTRPWPEADPLTWVVSHPHSAADLPPMLLVQGDVDELVSPAGAEHFADAVNAVEAGSAVVLHPPWRKHSDLTRLFLGKDPSLAERVIDWLGIVGSQG